MRAEHIAGLAYDRLIGRALRRAAVVIAIAACVLVAVYQFTVAGSLAIEARYGTVDAHLFIGAIYALLGLAGAGVIRAMRGRSTRAGTPTALTHQRETQLIMLVEAVMLGYALARKAQRTP
jgi:hypothetical protein